MNVPATMRAPQELERSFEAFTRISRSLEKAYDRLRAQAAKIDLALADTNRRLGGKVAELDAVLSSLRSAVVVTDPDGRIKLANRAFAELTAHTADALAGMRKSELADELGHPLCESAGALAEAVAFPCRAITVGGERRIVRSSCAPVTDEQGRAQGEVEALVDETELEALREELGRRETLTALGEMAAGIAHEIRNPLTAIEGFAHLLISALPDDQPECEEHARRISQAVRKANSIITNLLCFARPERFRPRRSRLGTLLAELRRSYCEVASGGEPSAGIGIGGDGSSPLARVDVVPPHPPELEVACDPSLIERVLVNLIDNARLAAGASGHVTVRARADDRDVVLSVEDDGPGIAAELRGKLFRPFVTGRAEGTGLGLFLVHRIVELHRGRVEVADRAGGGTTFTVHLPDLPARTAAAASRPAPPARTTHCEGMTA